MGNYIGLKKSSRELLDREFKVSVKGFREQLLDLQGKIDAEEAQAKDFSALKSAYYPAMSELINALLREPDRMARDFDLQQHILHKDYYRDQLGSLLWPAPLHSRALNKPLGYAGDYELMNMLYDEDPFHGPSAYFKLVHGASCRSVAGQAVVARVDYLMRKIHETTQSHPERRCRILSLGSGPAKEIQEFLRKYPQVDGEFHLIDQDAEAIAYAKSQLEKAQRDSESPAEIFYHNISIKSMMDPSALQAWQGCELIYSSGLFDYLEDDFFRMALWVLYSLLNEGGQLLLGNFSPQCYAKTGLWYLDDWPLIYRTESELLELTAHLPNLRRLGVDSEATGVNLFLNLER